MSNRKYALTYTIQRRPKGVTKEQVRAMVPDHGACDVAVLVSILYNSDGSRSQVAAGMDGRTGKPIDDDELWKAWAFLAHQLSQSETLGPGRRGLCAQVHEHVRAAIMSIRQPGDAKPGKGWASDMSDDTEARMCILENQVEIMRDKLDVPVPKSPAAILEDARTWLESSGAVSDETNALPLILAVTAAMLREVSPAMRRAIDAITAEVLHGQARFAWRDMMQRAIDSLTREG